MSPRVMEFAAKVIREAAGGEPADAVLRRKLKTASGFDPRESLEASRAVFSYYRWLGWLDQNQPIASQIEGAIELANRFQRQPESFSAEELLEKSIPGWVRNEMDCTGAWARVLQAEPRLWLRTRLGLGAELAKKLGHCRQVPGMPETLEYVGREDLFATKEFHAGEFEIQDISSQAVGLICAPQPGETWWDACAGEGGKLLHLADQMRNKGLIWATDRAGWRLERLKRRAARARVFNYRSRIWASGGALPVKTLFDGVLVDAPCSGIGTWQRNPHARWRTSAADVEELSRVQQELLATVARSVKPGGRLVYSVCSLEFRETREVARAFEQLFPSFERVQLSDPLKPKSPPAEEIWLWPQECGGNGMFIVAWKRRA